MLVQVAAAEWGADGLRVNAVAPGVTATPMLGRGASAQSSPWLAGVARRTALGRLGEAEDIAPVILGLHAMEWVTGQVVECDGGLALRSPINSYSAREAEPASGWRRNPSQTMPRTLPSWSSGTNRRGRRRPDRSPTTRLTTVSGVTSARTAPADWARCSRTPTASMRFSLTGAAASSNSMPAPMTAAIRSRLDALSSAMWFEEAEERGARIGGVGLGSGVLGQAGQALEEDGLAELLLGREVAVEGPDAHAGLLGDRVDRHLDPLGGEHHLGRLEDAGAVALRRRPAWGARHGGGVTASRYRRLWAHRKPLFPR